LAELGKLLDDVQGRVAKAPGVKLQAKPKSQLKRPAVAADAPEQPAKVARHAETTNGHSYDLQHVVVNFIDVGRAYAKTVLRKDAADGDLFDWEGVRTCVQHLASERGLEVLGVIPKGFEGEDSWSNTKSGVPEDVRTFCESVEEASSSLCSVHTVARAHRQNCRFVDNSSQSTPEGVELCDEECRSWLEKCRDVVQIHYTYDPDIGTFKTVEGSGTGDPPDASES